jgi:hypothetical protein
LIKKLKRLKRKNKMLEDRIVLREKLISINIEKNKASMIALDAGSSQCIVNKSYLVDIGIIDEKMTKQALRLIRKFYCGELN